LARDFISFCFILECCGNYRYVALDLTRDVNGLTVLSSKVNVKLHI